MLDDISRAPGEALNVLLRLLNERKLGDNPIPLISAVATGNPVCEHGYSEPLDPATADRFTLQVSVDGLIETQRWSEAAEVLDAARSRALDGSADEPLEGLEVAHATCETVLISGEVRRTLLVLLKVLAGRARGKGPGLSDRTFLGKALKVVQAEALLAGRLFAELDDLHAIRHLTTFRLPVEVNREVPEIIQAVINGMTNQADGAPRVDQSDGTDAAPSDGSDGSSGTEPDVSDGEPGAESTGPSPERPGGTSGAADASSEPDEFEPSPSGNDAHQGSDSLPGSSADDVEGAAAATAMPGAPSAGEAGSSASSFPNHLDLDQLMADTDALSHAGDGSGGEAAGESNYTPTAVSVGSLNPLLKTLSGRLNRGKAGYVPHRGGHPRSYRRLTEFSDFTEADPIESYLWNQDPSPQLPRVLNRYKIDGSGAVRYEPLK